MEETWQNQLRLVVHFIIYMVLYISGGAGFLPSTVCFEVAWLREYICCICTKPATTVATWHFVPPAMYYYHTRSSTSARMKCQHLTTKTTPMFHIYCLMEEILHQLIWLISHYLWDFILYPWWLAGFFHQRYANICKSFPRHDICTFHYRWSSAWLAEISTLKRVPSVEGWVFLPGLRWESSQNTHRNSRTLDFGCPTFY